MNKQSLVKNKYQDSESYFSFNEKTLEFKLEQVTNCLQKCYFNLFFFLIFPSKGHQDCLPIHSLHLV